MGLLSKALVFGLGYALGHPEGRRRLSQLQGQATGLTKHPQVVKVKEQAWDVAGDQALAVKNRVAKARSTSKGGAASTGTPSTVPTPGTVTTPSTITVPTPVTGAPSPSPTATSPSPASTPSPGTTPPRPRPAATGDDTAVATAAAGTAAAADGLRATPGVDGPTPPVPPNDEP